MIAGRGRTYRVPMARGDGDGWVSCRCGSAHWGRFGAAGLVLLRQGGRHDAPGSAADPGNLLSPPAGPRHGLATRPARVFTPGPADVPAGRSGPGPSVLLQLRADWTHQGGSWGVPGGARDSDENDVAAALREAAEEAAVLPGQLLVAGTVPGLDHGDWAYRYVLAAVVAGLRGVEDHGDRLRPRTTESAELRWVAISAVEALPLHDGLRAAWPGLHAEAGRVLGRVDPGAGRAGHAMTG